MTTSKVIDLEGLRRFKELLEHDNEAKFAAKEQLDELIAAFEENNQIATDEQVDSMLNNVFG